MWHPVRYVLATPNRLAVTAVLSSGVLVAASLWLDFYIAERSGTPGLNSLLLLLWMFLILAVSYVEALFVGDLLFPRGWRGALMQPRGHQPRAARERPEEPEPSDEEIVHGRRFRSYTVHFSLLLVLLALGNMLIVGQLGHGVLWKIEDVQLATALRSEDRETRLRAIERVTRLQTADHLVPFSQRLVELMDAPDPEVSTAATFGLAQVARRMRLSMEELRRVHQPQRWEKKLYLRLQTHWGRLLVRFRHSDETRAAVAAALGALGAVKNEDVPVVPGDAIRLFESYLGQSPDSLETKQAVVLAAGEMDALEGLIVPFEALRSGESLLEPVAAWAVGEILSRYDPDRYTREPLCIRDAIEIMDERLPELTREGRCAAVDALTRARDARAAAALFEVFDHAEPETTCPRLEMARPYGRPIVITTEEELKLKTLRAIASIAAGNEEVIGWLEETAEGGGLTERYQKEVEHVLDLARGETG